MAHLDEKITLATSIDLSGAGAEHFLSDVLSQLRPGEQTPINSMHLRADATPGPSMLAAQWALPDGTLVAALLTLPTRELILSVDPNPSLRDLIEAGGRPEPSPWWNRWLFLIGVPAVGIAGGVLGERIFWGVLAGIGALLGAARIGSAREKAARTARDHAFDEMAWRTRFQKAVAAVSASSPGPIHI